MCYDLLRSFHFVFFSFCLAADSFFFFVCVTFSLAAIPSCGGRF